MSGGRERLVAGCSPDPDDVFMFYGLTHGLVQARFEIEARFEEVQALNRRAMAGEYELTAISAAAYPLLSDRYMLLSAGASVGRGYGPVVVARRGVQGLAGTRIAVPGRHTTAYLMCRLFLAPFCEVEMPFDQVLDALTRGEVDCAVLIHEAQITWQAMGLQRIAALADLWRDATGGLPVPLGLEAVRRDAASRWGSAINEALVKSIRAGYDHLDQALSFAISFRQTGLDHSQGRTYLDMYVNSDTMALQPDVREALRVLYQRAYRAGFIDAVPAIEICE